MQNDEVSCSDGQNVPAALSASWGLAVTRFDLLATEFSWGIIEAALNTLEIVLGQV